MSCCPYQVTKTARGWDFCLLPLPTELEGDIGMSLSVRLFIWPFVHLSIHQTFENFAHLQTSYSSDLVQIWRINSSWDSPGLIDFWLYSTNFHPFPGLWLVKQFACIYRQSAYQIIILHKFGGWTLWDSPGLIYFWSCSAEFPLFPDLWLVEQFPHICRHYLLDWAQIW